MAFFGKCKYIWVSIFFAKYKNKYIWIQSITKWAIWKQIWIFANNNSNTNIPQKQNFTKKYMSVYKKFDKLMHIFNLVLKVCKIMQIFLTNKNMNIFGSPA